MPVSPEYIQGKLKQFAENGRRSIAEAVNRVNSEFIKHNSYGGSRNRMMAAQTVEDNFRAGMQEAARFLIEMDVHATPEAVQMLEVLAADMARDVVEAHKVHMFGNSAFDPGTKISYATEPPETIARLREVAALVIQDMGHGVVGNTRHAPREDRNSVTISANNSNLVVSSPGSTVQQGRDNLAQTLTLGGVELNAALERIETAARELDETSRKTIESLVSAARTEAAKPEPDQGVIRSTLGVVQRVAENAVAGAAGSGIAAAGPTIIEIVQRLLD